MGKEVFGFHGYPTKEREDRLVPSLFPSLMSSVEEPPLRANHVASSPHGTHIIDILWPSDLSRSHHV